MYREGSSVLLNMLVFQSRVGKPEHPEFKAILESQHNVGVGSVRNQWDNVTHGAPSPYFGIYGDTFTDCFVLTVASRNKRGQRI